MGISDIDLKEERAREDREDEAIEQKLRNDFDFFLNYFSYKFNNCSIKRISGSIQSISF